MSEPCGVLRNPGRLKTCFCPSAAARARVLYILKCFEIRFAHSNSPCHRYAKLITQKLAVFEKLVARSLLWLACRHHISELHIKHANEAVRGPGKGPDDKLFKSFREVFEKIVLNDRALWNWQNEGDWRKEKGSNVLEWATINMEKGTWIREDYRELLELVVIYLGGVTKRLRKDGLVVADVEIRRPGAIHQARFMSSCIYILKIPLFMHQSQLKLQENEEAEVKTLAEFILLVYAQYFLQTPLAIKAPGLDRDLWNDMHAYQACYPEDSMEQSIFLAVKESILRHLWYLTEELVVFGLSTKGGKCQIN